VAAVETTTEAVAVATIRTEVVAVVTVAIAVAEEMVVVAAAMAAVAVTVVLPKEGRVAVVVQEVPAVGREILAEVCNLEEVAAVLPARHREVEAGKGRTRA